MRNKALKSIPPMSTAWHPRPDPEAQAAGVIGDLNLVRAIRDTAPRRLSELRLDLLSLQLRAAKVEDEIAGLERLLNATSN